MFLFDFLSGELAINYLYHPDNKDKQFLILLDINMPGMDGWAFLEHLKQHSTLSSIHVVIVSSSKESSDGIRADGVNHAKMEAIRSIRHV
ncbi:response regulator [Pedobacter terrae]|uniref:response regulator n=1 Tax=Pedobacter terrae TaxID=405671 RepID=UPI003FA7A43E